MLENNAEEASMVEEPSKSDSGTLTAEKESVTTPEVVDENNQNEVLVNKKLNSVVNSYIKKLEKKFNDRLAEIENKYQAKEVKPNAEGKISAEAAELNLLKQKLEKIESERLSDIKEKDQAKAESKKLKKIDAVKSELVSNGISSDLVDLVISHLEYNQLVEYDEADKLVYKSDKGVIPLSEGVKQFAQSEKGKKLISVDSPVKQVKQKVTTTGFADTFQKALENTLNKGRSRP